MEALSDGGVLESESQIIVGLMASEDLSMVDASMLPSDPSVMMDFVGEDDDTLTAAFSNTFTNVSSTTTTPSSVRLSTCPPPASSTSSPPTSGPLYSSPPPASSVSSSFSDRVAGVVELSGHQHPLPTPLLVAHHHHHHHHHQTTSQPPQTPSHSHHTPHPGVQHHQLQRPQPQSSQHPHPAFYHHDQVAALSPGRSQNAGVYPIGGIFTSYISPSPLQQQPHPNPPGGLHEAHHQFLPPVKSEPSQVESFIPNLKTEPQEEFLEPLDAHLDTGQTPTGATPSPLYNPHSSSLIAGRGLSSVPYQSHHGPPPTPSPSSLSSIETNGTPSPAPQYMYSTHSSAASSAPYLLELAPLPSRQQQHHHHQPQTQHSSQQAIPTSTNGLTNYGNNTTPDAHTMAPLGYYEPSHLPQDDGRQVSTQGTHMMYLPASHTNNLKTRTKVSRKKAPPSPMNGDDLTDQKSMADQASNDSDDDNLIIDTSMSGEGYECAECGLVCRTRGGLRKHLTTEHLPDEPEPAETIPKQYACTMPLCHFSTTKRDAYDLHIANHIADGWTPTGKKRHNKNPLQRHRYNKEELTCPLCEYACTVEKAFRRHLKTHEPGQRSPSSKVSCCICGKDRPNEAELKKHMKKHRCGKYYRCDICKFQTVQLKKLIQHRRMHTGEKPHLCPFCPYRAARRDNLRSHVRRMHKRENMYGDTFTPRPVLVAEAEVHDPTGKQDQDVLDPLQGSVLPVSGPPHQHMAPPPMQQPQQHPVQQQQQPQQHHHPPPHSQMSL